MNSPLSVKIENRIFVDDSSDDEKYGKPLLKFFEEVEMDICKGSHLLSLNPEDTDNSSIYKAYGSDIDYLKTKTNEFQKWIHDAIFFSITISSSGKKAKNNINNKVKGTIMELLKVQIPRLEDGQFLILDYQLNQKIPEELLTDLQQQYKNAANLMVKTWLMWMEKLVEAELIGLVQWPLNNSSACLFYFFNKHREKIGETKEKKTIHRMITTMETFKTTTTSAVINERHVHHLVDSKVSKLSDYHKKIPTIVKTFVNSTPIWIRKHLMIVNGTVTLEEIDKVENVGDVSETVIKKKRSLSSLDPALIWGPFVAVAWNIEEIKEKPYDPFPVPIINVGLRKRLVYFFLLPISVIFGILTVLSIKYPEMFLNLFK